MKRTLSLFITAAALVALAATTTNAQKVSIPGCQQLPSESQLRQLLVQAQNVNKPIGGLFDGAKMWAAVVNRDGAVCAFSTSTSDPNAGMARQSGAIARAKAYTANAFKVLMISALSTARLYTFTQPGHSLWSLGQSNLFNPGALAPPSGQDGGQGRDHRWADFLRWRSAAVSQWKDRGRARHQWRHVMCRPRDR